MGRALKMIVAIMPVMFLFLAIDNANAHQYPPGPRVRPTIGQPWPKPQRVVTKKTILAIDPNKFNMTVTGATCDILKSAMDRYQKIIFGTKRHAVKTVLQLGTSGYLTELQLKLIAPCETYPSLNMDEHYEIKIDNDDNPGQGLLTSASIWGMLRGLETFSQIIYKNQSGVLVVNSTFIEDFPRFTHRGVLLDTSRHFLPVQVILTNIDAMAMNKFNVFHWHIVDDPSFPYDSKSFPQLSKRGAYDVNHIYSQADIQQIIEYSRLRGVRVLPEFDTPGHTQSWGLGVDNFLAQCYNGSVKTDHGPVDPTLDSTYKIMKRILGEVYSVFKDKYMHLGGDEVDFACWKSNPVIQKFVHDKGWNNDYSKLEGFYVKNILKIIEDFDKDYQYIIWQEVVDNNVTVSPNTVVQVWKGDWQQEMAKVTSKGLTAILSSCWYLNYITITTNWQSYYACDPQKFTGSAAQKAKVIGGEACMWGNYADVTNVVSRLWPRASAVAERLWSSAAVNSSEAAASRLEEHRCRMVKRGFRAEPVNGPGFCAHEFKP